MPALTRFGIVLGLFILLAACGGGDAEKPWDESVTDDGTTTGDPVEQTVGPVSSITIISGASEIVADGASSTLIRASVQDENGNPISGESVAFNTTAGALSAAFDITDANGYAEVTLASSTHTGTAAIVATAYGFSVSTSVAFVAGAADSILMYATPTSVSTNSSFDLAAAVTDANDNRIADERLTIELRKEGVPGSGNFNILVDSLEDNTDETGVFKATFIAAAEYDVDSGNDLRVSATTVNGTTNYVDITVNDTAIVIGSLTLIVANESIIADGVTRTLLRAILLDTDNLPMSNTLVVFETTAGTLEDLSGTPTTTKVTDDNGIAELYLRSETSPATAVVLISTGGFADSQTISFVPGAPSIDNSMITATPNSLAADGVSVTEVTVLLVDANDNLVSNGTAVTLQTSDGDIISTNPSVTSSGRATFELQAPNIAALAELTLFEYPGITGSVEFGATGTGEPANITPTVETPLISVSGVGQIDSTSIALEVYDDSGSLVSDPGYNNLKISFLTHPNGGEFISGVNFSGTVVSSTDYILVDTNGGTASINLQAGTLPGVVELKIEVIDEVGASLSPEVIAQIPQISIASGPPHTIALSTPITNSIENIGGGFYRRKGTLIVTDRFGNAVPDGTAINLGIMDSVIAKGTTGEINTANTTSANELYDASPILSNGDPITFDMASITRNAATRFIQQNDRLLITDIIDSEDKARFIGADISANSVDVQTDYASSSLGSLEYVIGAALLGAEIAGVDDTGNLTTGSVTTTDGLAGIRVTYPANINTIRVGCGYVPLFDERQSSDLSVDQSARVFAVATSTDGSAAMVDEGTLCFSSIAGWSLTPIPSIIGGTSQITLTLRDGGDTILLPYAYVSASVRITKDDDASMSVGVAFNVPYFTPDGAGPYYLTNIGGSINSTITVSGRGPEDTAEVTYYSGDAKATVKIE